MPYSPELLEEIIKGQDSFVWEAPSRERRNRGPRWYIITSIIAVVLVIYAVVTSNFLFALLILLGAILLVATGNQEPERILIQVGKNGVVVDGRLYEYPAIQQFAIVYQPPYTKILYIEPKSVFQPRVRIYLEEENPVEIRNHLKQYVQENLALQDEYISDILARLLKI